jgi:hypothetical protein
MKGIFLSLLAGIALAGCTEGGAVARYYVQNTRVPQKGPVVGQPRVYRYSTADINSVLRPFITKGYRVVGYSAYTGTGAYPSDSEIKQQAQKIRASVVVCAHTYHGTYTRVGPIPLINPLPSETANPTLNRADFTEAGGAQAYNSGTTGIGDPTASGPLFPNYFPVTRDVWEKVAVFLRK